ncbi:hypothetical protein KC337_g114 [Hortaea werneckii]|nr:hypothetical protein KC337_g114 [Hortaea werneckii]
MVQSSGGSRLVDCLEPSFPDSAVYPAVRAVGDTSSVVSQLATFFLPSSKLHRMGCNTCIQFHFLRIFVNCFFVIGFARSRVRIHRRQIDLVQPVDANITLSSLGLGALFAFISGTSILRFLSREQLALAVRGGDPCVSEDISSKCRSIILAQMLWHGQNLSDSQSCFQ